MKSKRILIVGQHSSVFLIRLMERISDMTMPDLEIEFFDTYSFSDKVNKLEIPYKTHGVVVPKLLKPLLRIPKIRVLLRIYLEYKSFAEIIKNGAFDAFNIHELPYYTQLFIRYAHKCGVKSILTPIGSDALRIEGKSSQMLKKAFDETDYVTITENSGFAKKVFDKFDIDRTKVRNLSYGSDAISEICRIEKLYSRKMLSEILNIPYSDYYICCGYNAHRAQNHSIILDAIAANEKNLPQGYKLLIPLGYGDKEVIRKELEDQNRMLHLDIVYVMDFLSATKVAALRVITDLFIHIQDTDAHSFTIREFLLADTQIINGRWLSYPELEQYGVPYHVCESKETLKDVIGHVLTGQMSTIKCSPELKTSLRESSWDNVAHNWMNFYQTA